MPNLSLRDQLLERAGGFLESHAIGSAAILIGVRQPVEQHHGTVGPMQLVEVDVIGLQPLQRALDGIKNVLAVEASDLAVAKPGHGGAAHDLGGEHDVFARSPSRETTRR